MTHTKQKTQLKKSLRLYNPTELGTLYRLFHDYGAYKRMIASTGTDLTPRLWHYLTREIARYASNNLSQTKTEDVRRADERHVAATKVYLRKLQALRTSQPESAQKLSYQRFIIGTRLPIDGDDNGMPSGIKPSEIESRLADYVMFMCRGNKMGAPKKKREPIFCALYLVFEATHATPTANYNDGAGRIESQFVTFASNVVSECPGPIRDHLAKNLAGNLRKQLRAWRKNPTRDGSPHSTMQRQILKNLQASTAVSMGRKSSLIRSPILYPERIATIGVLLSPTRRSREKKSSKKI